MLLSKRWSREIKLTLLAPETQLDMSRLRIQLLGQDLGYKMFTKENCESRGELWSWDRAQDLEPARQRDLQQGHEAGTSAAQTDVGKPGNGCLSAGLLA